jgi:hypothetical protein
MNLLAAPLLAVSLATTPAEAPEDRPAPPAYHVDAEVDPTAYVLSGYSLHLGVGYRRVRLDLGAYAMALPSFASPNDAFDASFDGFGAKLQLFLLEEQTGPFVGVDAGVSRLLVERSGQAERQTQIGTGAHAGWRIGLPAGFYATPWIGVTYIWNTAPVSLAGATFEPSRVTVFPAIHLGYRFL